MKVYARCISPTSLLNKGEVYLIELVRLCQDANNDKFYHPVSSWNFAEYANVLGVLNRRAYPIRVTASRFEPVTYKLHEMNKEDKVQPVYNFIDEEDFYVETGLSKSALESEIRKSEQAGNLYRVEKVSFNGKIITQDITNQITKQIKYVIP